MIYELHSVSPYNTFLLNIWGGSNWSNGDSLSEEVGV